MWNKSTDSFTLPQHSTESTTQASGATTSKLLHRLKMVFNRRVQIVILVVIISSFLLFSVVDNQKCDDVSCMPQVWKLVLQGK